MSAPTWEQLRELMLAPTPPVTATVYAIGRDPASIDTGAADPGPPWALAWVDPSRLAALPGTAGRVVGTDTEGGRDRWIAEVTGLKGRAPVKVWVDAQLGSIVRLERMDDPAPLVMIEGLTPG